MERPIRSFGKLPMRLEGPLFCCDSEWSFLTPLTHKSYRMGSGPRNSSPRAGDLRVPLSSQGRPAVLAPWAASTESQRPESTPLRTLSFQAAGRGVGAPAMPHSVTANAHLLRPAQSGSVRGAWGPRALSVVELARHPRSPDFPGLSLQWVRADRQPLPPASHSLLQVVSNWGKEGTNVFPSALSGSGYGFGRRVSQDWACRRDPPWPRNSRATWSHQSTSLALGSWRWTAQLGFHPSLLAAPLHLQGCLSGTRKDS